MRRFSVDIEVERSKFQKKNRNLRVSQEAGSLDQGSTVVREDGTGQSVLGSSVDKLASLLPGRLLGVVPNVTLSLDKSKRRKRLASVSKPEIHPAASTHGDDRSKDLLDHGARLGVFGEDDSGLNVETLGIVPSSSRNNLTTLSLGLFDHSGDLGERWSTDDGSDKVLPFGRRSDGDLGDFLLHDSLKLGPHGLGYVGSGESGALLSLVFEPGSDGLEDTGPDVGRGVVQVEVLASGLSDNPGVSSVSVEVHSNVLPELLEDVGRSGKVQPGKLSVVDTLLDDLGRVTRGELDDASGQASLEQDLVGQVVGVGGSGRGLPDDDVTHDGGGKDEVSSNGGKVEGSDGEDEPFEGPVLGSAETERCNSCLASRRDFCRQTSRRLTSKCWPSSWGAG